MNKANFFWSGSPLKRHHYAVYRSFIHHGWDVTVWTYDSDLKDVDRIKFKNANEILDQSRIGSFTYSRCLVHDVPFSDLFRLHVLKSVGGWWFDSDCFCLRDYSDFELVSYNRYYVAGWEFNESINNAVLHFTNQQLLADLLTYVETQIEPEMVWGQIGPRSLTKFLTDVNLTYQALPSWVFFSVPWGESAKGAQDEHIDYIKQLTKPSLVYHYYNSVCHQMEPNGYIGYLTNKYS